MAENRRLNIVVLGDIENMPCTVIVDVLQAKINIKNKTWNLILWDTAGQEQFRAIVRNYFRKADGVLLVYDVTNLETFTDLPKWLSDLRRDNEIAPVIIVGSKIDKASSEGRVTVEQVKEFADRNKLDFMESSAKSGENVDKIFERLTCKILSTMAESESTEAAKNEDGTVHSSRNTNLKKYDSIISLHKTTPSKKPKKKCC